jgi:MFS family permease
MAMRPDIDKTKTPGNPCTIPLKGSDEALEKHDDSPSGAQTLDTEYQTGVQKIEAVTITWSKASMILAFVLIWLIYFIQGLVTTINGALLPYVTSAFASHSLTATTGVMSAVVGGISNLSIAKMLDVFGRPQGFFFAAVLATIGLIMSAACNNVESYAAAQVFYTVGINGIGYSMSVFIADITTLRNRGLVQALASSANIITVWLGGPISTAFLNGAGWRWAFGMESILIPVVTAPMFGLFMYRFLQAKKLGIVPTRDSGRNTLQSLQYYGQEFDLLGLLLLSAGVAFFLLPFNLYTQQAKGWDSALVISFLIIGVVLLIGFGLWERLFAKQSLVPWAFMKDRTVVGACLASFTLFFSNSCWAFYLGSILQVINNLSVTEASYVNAIPTVGGVIAAVLTGVVMSYTGRFKAITLYISIPLVLLGTGLLILFRRPDGNIGYIVMCIIFLSVGNGISTVTIEIAILAAMKSQQYFAIAVALVSTTGGIGSAIGLTVSSAIWQDVFPKQLAVYLPKEELPNLVLIYSDITTQLSYPVGSPTRLAIQKAYGDGEEYLLIAGICTWFIGIIGTVMWSNIDIIHVKQTKGRVF